MLALVRHRNSIYILQLPFQLLIISTRIFYSPLNFAFLSALWMGICVSSFFQESTEDINLLIFKEYFQKTIESIPRVTCSIFINRPSHDTGIHLSLSKKLHKKEHHYTSFKSFLHLRSLLSFYSRMTIGSVLHTWTKRALVFIISFA